MSKDTDQFTLVDRLANEYHDQHARQPLETVEICKPVHHDISSRLHEYLREAGLCTTIEYTGSAYEQTLIGPEVEFDLMLVMPQSAVRADPHPDRPGFAYLVDQDGDRIDPRATMDSFKGEVQRFINEEEEEGLSSSNTLEECDMLLRDHGGPAIQMDVSGVTEAGEAFDFAVDLVPTHKVDGEFYVAKPLRDNGLIDDEECDMLWRMSGSPMEKSILKPGRGNVCHKKVIRICKCVRDRDFILRPMASIMIKSQVMWEMKKRPDLQASWTSDQLGQRTNDTLKHLADSFRRGELKKFSVPEINLLQDLPLSTGINIASHIHRLVNNPHKLYPTESSTEPFDLNAEAREFHDSHACRPKAALSFCKASIHEHFTLGVIPALRRGGFCQRFEYIGSAYDRTQVGPTVDIDLCAVQRPEEIEVKYIKSHPGYAFLIVDGSGKRLDPRVCLEHFKGGLQQILADDGQGDQPTIKAVLQDKNAGFKVDVFDGLRLQYAVNITLAYEVDQQMYLASRSREETAAAKKWRLGNPVAEKNFLRIADYGSGVRAQALRTCKAIRNREPDLRPLTSRILKAALFLEMGKHSKKTHWVLGKLGNRVIDILTCAKSSLDQGYMENPCHRIKVNVLAGMPEETRSDISHCLGQLLSNRRTLFCLNSVLDM